MTTLPPLWGLVLAGGRSVRMGQDKGALALNGTSQRQFVADMLSRCCERVFISCRSEQSAGLEPGLGAIVDTYANIGPIGGIASAMARKPEVAWFIIACDLPDLTDSLLAELVVRRLPGRPAVAFEDPQTRCLEPLIAIWEPAMCAVVLQAIEAWRLSPRAILESTGCHAVMSAQALTNLNTPAELSAWRAKPPV